MNNLDERISAALHAAVDGLGEQDLRPAAPPVEEGRRRQTIRWVAPLLTAAAVAAAITTTFALTSSPTASHNQQRPGAVSPSPVPTAPVSGTLSIATSAAPTVSVPPPALPAGDEPLWPFANAGEAAQWENVDGPNGHSPWHAGAKATALFFATGYLQFNDITEVTASDVRTMQADVSVGYDMPSGDKHTASEIHLVRYGDENAPWEVVGATATGFSITDPASGTEGSLAGPVHVAGRITGVDENVTAAVRSIDGAVNGSDPIPAGGDNASWVTIVPDSDLQHGVLSIIAWTGGHLTAHERFAVVGVVNAGQ